MVLPSVAETAEAAVEYWLYLAVDDDDPFYSDEFNRDELRQWFAAMWARTAGPSVVAKLAIVQLHNPVTCLLQHSDAAFCCSILLQRGCSNLSCRTCHTMTYYTM